MLKWKHSDERNQRKSNRCVGRLTIVKMSILSKLINSLQINLCEVKSLSCVRLFSILWTVVYQASLSMGSSRQEYWSGLPYPSAGELPDSACQWGRCKRLGFNPWVWKIPWKRKWKPTPVFLRGESHGQRGLVGYSPRGHKESDTTEAT